MDTTMETAAREALPGTPEAAAMASEKRIIELETENLWLRQTLRSLLPKLDNLTEIPSALHLIAEKLGNICEKASNEPFRRETDEEGYTKTKCAKCHNELWTRPFAEGEEYTCASCHIAEIEARALSGPG